MRPFSKFIVLAAMVTAPLMAFAQSDIAPPAPVTHAAVEAQLATLERAGYMPRAKDHAYPADVQAAESKVARQQISSPTRTASAP